MLGRLGEMWVLLALGAASAGAVTGFAAGSLRSHSLLRHTQRFTRAFALFMTLAFVTMEVALLRHDFSVKYVAKVGSLASPLHITIVTVCYTAPRPSTDMTSR